jgi:putative aminopeptidase FrvX
VGKDPLVTGYDNWRDMQIVVDDAERDLVFVGDSVRPHHQWLLGPRSLQATILDNRIGVAQLLLVAHERQNLNRNRNDIALCFCTEEEVRNKGALYYMQTYKPQKLIIPDICPQSLVPEMDMHRCAVIGKTDDFVLDQ